LAPGWKNGYFEGVARSAGSLTASSAASALAELPREACVRGAAGWALGVGGLVAAHRLKQGGGAAACARAAAAAGAFTFLSQFVLCRQQLMDTKVAMRLFAQRAAAAERGEGAELLRQQGAPPPPPLPPAAPRAA